MSRTPRGRNAGSTRGAGAAAKVRAPAARRRGAGGTLLGIFIGLALGLALAAGIAWMLMGGRHAAPAKAPEAPGVPRDAKGEKSGDADKDRFRFYRILPGGEEPKLGSSKGAERPQAPAARATEAPKAEQRPSDRVASTEPSAPKGAKPGDRLWLQAGSFTQEPDAENLKARLALAGWEARVQQGTLQDKSVRYRVRLGPYDNPDELTRVKNELARRGFDVAVIRE
ncbi:MAG TPA: SPOR domain-containing protein [Casimicrobiaceae bacterium]|nr:SPOR domain-containing protein [Casimicrobiaceae bacterium]